MVSGLRGIQPLHAGMEYDLPKEFAAYLILERKADFRPGRLKKFAPKEIRAPIRKTPVKLSKVLTLED